MSYSWKGFFKNSLQIQILNYYVVMAKIFKFDPKLSHMLLKSESCHILLKRRLSKGAQNWKWLKWHHLFNLLLVQDYGVLLGPRFDKEICFQPFCKEFCWLRENWHFWKNATLTSVNVLKNLALLSKQHFKHFTIQRLF